MILNKEMKVTKVKEGKGNYFLKEKEVSNWRKKGRR